MIDGRLCFIPLKKLKNRTVHIGTSLSSQQALNRAIVGQVLLSKAVWIVTLEADVHAQTISVVCLLTEHALSKIYLNTTNHCYNCRAAFN